MFSLFVLTALASILISAFCSLTEAVIYSVPLAYARELQSTNPKTGDKLRQIKESIGSSITAILIFNTIANTAGAAFTGYLAGELFGSNFLLVFSVFFTLLILYGSEIIPKMIGVSYCKPLSRWLVWPLSVIIKICGPLVRLSEKLSLLINRRNDGPRISASEIISMAKLGQEEGTLDELEGSIIKNVIGLDKLLVKDVLTPRVLVFMVSEDLTILEAAKNINNWHYTRVPVYSEENPEVLKGYITQRDVYRAINSDDNNLKLKDIARKIDTVPELLRADKLLLRFFEKREHLCAVVDEHGGLAGIITMEDILEEIVGKEIHDEFDSVKDTMRFEQVSKLKKRR